MVPSPSKNYILIKCSKSEEEKKREKVGSLFLAPDQVFMTRNLQYGEIVAIGEKAKQYFPEAQVGQILLCHHFVQAQNKQEAKENHLIYEDESFNYYVVSVFDINEVGKGNETYGVWDGEKIIPNKDYIFLEPEIDKEALKGFDNEEILAQVTTKTKGGLIIFNEWKMSREEKVTRMQEIKKEIEHLSKSNPNKPHVRVGIQLKEEELSKLSLELNEKRYEPYTVAYFNEQLYKDFNGNLSKGDTMYLLNIATQTHIEFNGKKLRVAKINYIGFVYRPVLDKAS